MKAEHDRHSFRATGVVKSVQAELVTVRGVHYFGLQTYYLVLYSQGSPNGLGWPPLSKAELLFTAPSFPALAPSAMGTGAPRKASSNSEVAPFRLWVTWELATIFNSKAWGQKFSRRGDKLSSEIFWMKQDWESLTPTAIQLQGLAQSMYILRKTAGRENQLLPQY